MRRLGSRADPDLRAAASARIGALDSGTLTDRVRYRRAASPDSERASLARLLASWAEDSDR